MADNEVTVKDVAAWMLEQVQTKPLYQDEAAWKIKRRFGRKFVYDNEHGNPAIARDVLTAFRKVSGDNIIWSRSERLWRKRTPRDAAGRLQE